MPGRFKINSDLSLAGFLSVFCLAFFSFWWNSVLPPSVGGELFYLESHARGVLPYRDYFQNVPPGCNFLALWGGALFGARMAPFLALGVAIRVASAVCLFLLLRRAFRPTTAAFAAAVTLVYSSIDRADHPLFYNHIAAALAVFAATSMYEALARRGALAAGLAALGGVCLSFGVLIKHTVGVASTLCLVTLFCIVLLRRGALRAALAPGLGLLVGLTAPMIGLWIWLSDNGLTALFWEQLFHSGPAAKGGLAAFFRPVVAALDFGQFGAPALVGLLALVAGAAYLRAARSEAPGLAGSTPLLVGGLALMAAMLAGFHMESWTVHSGFLALCYLVLYTTGLLSAHALYRLFREPDSEGAVPVAFCAAAGFSVAYSLSISWPAFEMMLFPGLALLLCMVLDRPAEQPLRAQVSAVVVSLCLLLLGYACWQKATYPYSWGRWIEPPVRFATVEPKVQQLGGMVLSPTTARFYEWVVKLVQDHSKETDRIYVYPNMGNLYGLTRRMPSTFLASHWVDITPDDIAVKDAGRLLASPPAVMIIHDDAPGELEREETLFRGGRTSGTRAIKAAMSRLKKTRFVIKGSYPVYGSRTPIEVWVRKGR